MPTFCPKPARGLVFVLAHLGRMFPEKVFTAPSLLERVPLAGPQGVLKYSMEVGGVAKIWQPPGLASNPSPLTFLVSANRQVFAAIRNAPPRARCRVGKYHSTPCQYPRGLPLNFSIHDPKVKPARSANRFPLRLAWTRAAANFARSIRIWPTSLFYNTVN